MQTGRCIPFSKEITSFRKTPMISLWGTSLLAVSSSISVHVRNANSFNNFECLGTPSHMTCTIYIGRVWCSRSHGFPYPGVGISGVYIWSTSGQTASGIKYPNGPIQSNLIHSLDWIIRTIRTVSIWRRIRLFLSASVAWCRSWITWRIFCYFWPPLPSPGPLRFITIYNAVTDSPTSLGVI